MKAEEQRWTELQRMVKFSYSSISYWFCVRTSTLGMGMKVWGEDGESLGETFLGDSERHAWAKVRKQVIAIGKQHFCKFLAIPVNSERVLRQKMGTLQGFLSFSGLDAFFKGLLSCVIWEAEWGTIRVKAWNGLRFWVPQSHLPFQVCIDPEVIGKFPWPQHGFANSVGRRCSQVSPL